MASKIPVERIKEKAPIVEYITIHYPSIILKRSGNVYLACCPFHDEKSPSLAVWDNGTYKCFGCGEYGDIIKFVMKKENLNFKEACKVIATNVGVEYVLEPPNPAHEKYKDQMNEHARRYWRVLQGNNQALKYLRDERGLTDESIQMFRIGLVPSDEYKFRSDIGGIASRLAFPILEHREHTNAKCIAMGYRTLIDEKPKYKNDSNKDQDGDPLKGVYVKGNTLYGYSLAFQEIRRLNYAVVTEGYIDVISMHQAGVINTVAPLGTALTEVQADVLKKLTTNLILFLDGDKAGIDSMFRVLPMLLEKGFNVMMIVADQGMDAADVCRSMKFDTNAIKAYVNKNSKPAMNVVIDRAAGEYEQIATRERIKAMSSIAPLLDKIQSPTERDIFKNMAYKRLDMAGA